MKDFRENIRIKPDFSGNYNIFPGISIILIATAVLLLLIALLTDKNDFTSALLVAVSLINFLTAITIISFTAQQGIDPDISAMLYPALITDKTGIFSKLNVYGDAYFVPKNLTGSDETVQFNPTGEFIEMKYKDTYFSIDDQRSAGIYTRPSSNPLTSHLEAHYDFKLYPGDNTSAATSIEALKGCLIEATSFCEDIELRDNEDNIVISLKNPSFISGCQSIRNESPKCCTVSPCPVCSMICVVLAESLGRITTISAINPDEEKNEITIILKALPHPPTDTD